MALQTWKQLGAAADIEDCRMESVLTMGRLCRRLNPKFESRITTEEDRSSETVCMLCGKDQTETEYMVHVPDFRLNFKLVAACCQYASPVSAEEFLPRKTIQPCHVMKNKIRRKELR